MSKYTTIEVKGKSIEGITTALKTWSKEVLGPGWDTKYDADGKFWNIGVTNDYIIGVLIDNGNTLKLISINDAATFPDESSLFSKKLKFTIESGSGETKRVQEYEIESISDLSKSLDFINSCSPRFIFENREDWEGFFNPEQIHISPWYEKLPEVWKWAIENLGSPLQIDDNEILIYGGDHRLGDVVPGCENDILFSCSEGELKVSQFGKAYEFVNKYLANASGPNYISPAIYRNTSHKYLDALYVASLLMFKFYDWDVEKLSPFGWELLIPWKIFHNWLVRLGIN